MNGHITPFVRHFDVVFDVPVLNQNLSIKYIEIINNTRGGIQRKIWERANGGQIQVPDVLNNENCTVHPNIELIQF